MLSTLSSIAQSLDDSEGLANEYHDTIIKNDKNIFVAKKGKNPQTRSRYL